MAVRLRAPFDGRVLVPEEPPDLPVNEPLTVRIEVPWPATSHAAARLAALDRIAARAASVNPPAEALTRESIYEDRP